MSILRAKLCQLSVFKFVIIIAYSIKSNYSLQVVPFIYTIIRIHFISARNLCHDIKLGMTYEEEISKWELY